MKKCSQTMLYRRLFDFLLCLPLLLTLSGTASAQPETQAVINKYIAAWQVFYPSAAFAYGDTAAAARFEDYTEPAIAQWLAFNETTAAEVRALLEPAQVILSTRIDLQVLLGQVEDELANWREERPLTQQPQWYAEQVSQALTHLLVRDQLSEEDRSMALIARLQGVQRLCDRAVQSLGGGNALRTQTALRTLQGTRDFYSGNLRTLTAAWPEGSKDMSIAAAIDLAADSIGDFEAHLRINIMPAASASAAINTQYYAAKLARRTSGLYTPATLLAAAADEMRDVRVLINAEARRWQSAVPKFSDTHGDSLLAEAIEAMENDRQDNSADFLASFTTLTFAAQRFVEEQHIASVPKPTTLIIALSPSHFSGAAVGGVYPTGPFAPESDTLFYVPSISDAAERGEQDGFYRSFNTHFNTMIMSHEMFPGHYLQYKVAVRQAPPIRSLFANGSYVEGWGSFSEELMLDAGWAENAPLTRLAHLRKRLENATRAYVSVQVNTAGWGELQVLTFARDEGLLAPQFAKNLWDRVVNSPLQITDYFTGYQHFKRLFAIYQASPQNDGPQRWVDAVLRAGPVPPVMLEKLL
jgi:uncharacterized protein (DUF885 family)